jgi:uncharacterized protein YegL
MNRSLIFLLDVSGSMISNGRNVTLFEIMKELQTTVLQRLEPPAGLDLTVRILAFGNQQVTWVCGDRDGGVPHLDFNWTDVEKNIPKFNGDAPLGKAIAEVVETLYFGDDLADPEQYAPMIILISDGQPTDDYQQEMQKANDKKASTEIQGLFRRSIRVAIGLELVKYDEGRKMLQSFGRISSNLKRRGFQSYYDIGNNNLNKLGDIVTAMIIGGFYPNYFYEVEFEQN